MKYAVIRTGGKQYRVSKGDELDIEKLEFEENKEVVFDDVLLVVDGDKVFLEKKKLAKAKVKGTIVKQRKGDKIRVARFRRRKRHHKVKGHRQQLTRVKVISIEVRSGK